MTLTFIQDGSIMSSAIYLVMANIRPKFEKKNVQLMKEIWCEQEITMKYTKRHNYVKSGENSTVPFLCTSPKLTLNCNIDLHRIGFIYEFCTSPWYGEYLTKVSQTSFNLLSRY